MGGSSGEDEQLLLEERKEEEQLQNIAEKHLRPTVLKKTNSNHNESNNNLTLGNNGVGLYMNSLNWQNSGATGSGKDMMNLLMTGQNKVQTNSFNNINS